MRSLFISLFTAASVVSSPWGDSTTERDLRSAQNAFDRGDYDSAEHKWQSAQVEVPDPGFIAYNRGIVALIQQDYASAEQHFLNAMNDTIAPANRRAEATFHRAIALIGLNRSSEDCLEAIRLIRSVSTDLQCSENLRVQSAFYIELAKQNLEILRKQRRAQQQTTPDTSEENPAQPATMSPDRTETAKEPASPRMTADSDNNPSTSPTETTQQTAGSGKAPVTPPEPWPQPLTKEQGKDWLGRIAERLKRERLQQAELLARPERKNIRDW